MNVTLAPGWELTTDHAASSHGIPVLVHRTDMRAYGPDDMVELVPSWGSMRAHEAVQRAARSGDRPPRELKLITLFIGEEE